MIKHILITLLALSTLPLDSRAVTTSYQYSRAITVPHAQVANTDQANFPIYLVFNDPGLKTTSNGGHVQSATGADIAFFGDSALTQVLPFEVVSYNGATGTVTAVVNYPSLSHSVDTVFYLAYGMSGTVSAANPSAVWSQYLGVYHLEDNAANTAILNSATGDTAGKSVNNTASMSVAGKLGSGLKFNGSSDMLDFGPYSSMDNATTATYSGWVNFAGFSDYALILARINSSNAAYIVGLGASDCCSSDTDWLTTARTHNGVASYTAGYGIQPGTWYYFTSVFSAGTLTLYVNGTQVTLNNFGGVNSVIPAITADLIAGAAGTNGTLDELRVSTRAYSPDWITTEYNDMSNPAAFAVLGSEAAFVAPPPAQPLNVTVLGVTPTQAILGYVAPDNNACSVAVSSSGAVNTFTGVFTSLVHDLDPGLFPGADQDTKSGNLVNGTQRTIVVGHRGVGDGSDGNIYSLALQAATAHYFRISCGNGAYIGTGSFKTADIPLGNSAPDTIPYDANGFGGYGWPTINFVDQSTKYIDPQTGALLQRLTGSGDQMYSQYPKQGLNSPVDLSGGAWSNLGNIGASSDGASATYSGAGGPNNGMFMALAFTGLGRYSFNSNDYSALDDINLHLHGSGDPVMACLSGDDGQTCLGTPLKFPLPTSGAGDVAGPANYPAPLFQGWGNAHVTPDMLTNNFGINVTLTGNSLVWNSGSDSTGQPVYFPVTTLKPGTLFYLQGSYYHVASIQDQQHLTVVESASSPINGTAYFLGFGIKIWKQPGGAGTVNIDSAYVDLSLSNTFGTEDQGFGSTGCSGNVTVSYAADGVTPIAPVTGYLCTFVTNYGSLVWKLMIPSTGEVRKISNLNGLSPGGGSAPTNFYAYNSNSGLITFCSYDVDDPTNGRFKAWFDNFNASSNNPAISCHDLSSQYTVTQEIQMAHPEIDLNYYGAPSFQGDSYPYFVFLMRPAQNQAYWACVVDVSQPSGAAQAQNCHNSWATYPIRWAANHGGEFAAGGNVESYIMVPMQIPNQQGVGQYTLSINTVYNNGGSTAVSSSFYDPQTCQALGVTDARWIAAGANGRNCIKINVAGEPVNTNPNLNDINPLGSFPVGSKPGPWPHNSTACNGDGTTSNCWGYLQPMIEGDYIGDTAGGSSEPFLLAKKTVLANGTIDLVLARNMNSFYERGGNPSPENHATGWIPWMEVPNGGGASGVFYSPFGKPFGSTTVADNPTLFQAHTIDWGNSFGNDIHITAQAWLSWPQALGGYGAGYGVRYGQTPSVYSQGFLYGVQANYGFNGSFHGVTIGQIQSHPGGGTYAAPQRESVWAVDGRPLGGAAGGSNFLWNHTYSKVSGNNDTYKISVPLNGDGSILNFSNWDVSLDIKNRAVYAWAGYHLLKDISGPNSVISDATPWSFCIALQANECVSGSNPKDQFVSVPHANTSGSCLIDGTQLTPCIATVGPEVGGYTQFDVSRADPFGQRWRKLSMAFGGPGRTDNFANMHAFATGDWTVTAGKWLDGRRSDVLGVMLPPWPNEDSIVRNTFVRVPVKLSGQTGTSARIRFGYSPSLFCSSRQEQCSTAVSNADPYAFLSEQQTWTPCSSAAGCEIDIPAQSSRVLYYVVDRMSASGSIGSTPVMLTAVE